VRAAVTPRLYEPFFTTKPQGMGIGLVISRTIVELRHGRLSVEPRESGLGTTVRLVLPVGSVAKVGGGIDMTAVPTVFVVDDNPGVRQSLQALVEAEGLAVATYASAAEFLEAWDAKRPGCLVLDVRLRGDSGLNLQDELRRRNATLPIIVMTGYADVPTSVRALKGGAIDFLRKPVPPKQLIARIREAIDVDRRTRDAAERRAAVTDRIAQLTPREREVMELLAVGNSSKAIAAALRISVRTVESHRRTVLRKLGVSSAAQLARAVARIQLP
jgi:two-component system, LuxR family, response regulator FixJ